MSSSLDKWVLSMEQQEVFSIFTSEGVQEVLLTVCIRSALVYSENYPYSLFLFIIPSHYMKLICHISQFRVGVLSCNLYLPTHSQALMAIKLQHVGRNRSFGEAHLIILIGSHKNNVLHITI